MSIIRPVLTCFTIAAIPAACVLARDKPSAPARQNVESLTTVKKEYEEASKAWSSEFKAAYTRAKDIGKERGFKSNKPFLKAQFSPRFLSIAESFKDSKWRETIGKGMSKEYEQEQVARAERAKIELEGLRKALRNHYSDFYN